MLLKQDPKARVSIDSSHPARLQLHPTLASSSPLRYDSAQLPETGSLFSALKATKLDVHRTMTLLAMAFLWTGSQTPLYFYGGIEQQILAAVGGYDKSVWIGLGYLIPLGIVTPFTGALSDLFGRKSMGITAFLLLILGNIVIATASSINGVISGSVLSGIGGGIGELVGLAVVGEITASRNRGFCMGIIHLSILPFAPAVMYAQFIARSSSWKWCGLVVGGWCFVGLILTIIFYRPLPRNSEFTRNELAQRVDYIGGLLSAVGLTLFLVGLVFSAEGSSWKSVKVLSPFIIGIATIGAFILWEVYVVKYPIFPRRLGKNPQALTVILIITFASGANFFATLLFWPSQYQSLYAENNAVSSALGSLPTGFGIILGGMIGTILVSYLRKQIRWLMVFCTALMTAANGAIACGTSDNLSTLWPIVTFACISVGLTVVPNQVLAGIICPTELIGTITAATISLRIIGGAISYAIYYNVYDGHLRSLVSTTIAPAAVAAGVGSPEQIAKLTDIIGNGGGFHYLTQVPGVMNQTQIDLLTTAGKLASSESYSQVYYVSIAFGAVAFVASFFLTGVDKNMEDTAAVDLK